MSVIVRQPKSLPRFAYQKMAEGARFETPTSPETIDLDLLLSFHSQSFSIIYEGQRQMNGRSNQIGHDGSATIKLQRR